MWVKEKETTTRMVSSWIAVLRFFRNIGGYNPGLGLGMNLNWVIRLRRTGPPQADDGGQA